MKRGIHTLPVRGATDEWVTPEWLTEALGPFDLDPCAAERMPWHHAPVEFTASQDGLAQPWEGRVWLNPPYGEDVGLWLERMMRHGNGVALIAARTETRAFEKYVWEAADAIIFLLGRLRFYRTSGRLGEGNAGHNSCLVAYGWENAAALRACGLRGILVENWAWTESIGSPASEEADG